MASLATLVALFYIEEDVRGKWAWEKYQQQQEAKGEKFDLVSLAPPAIPDEKNFAMAPMWKAMFEYHLGEHRKFQTNSSWSSGPTLSIDSMDLGTWPNLGDWLKGERINLAAWQDYYRGTNRPATNALSNASVINTTESIHFPTPDHPGTPAADVLFALSPFDKELKDLQAAARRPGARFPIHYEDGYFAHPAHIVVMQPLANFLVLHAAAELEPGNKDAADEDVRLEFKLIQSFQGEPLGISQLVRIGITRILLHSVWDGLVTHRWSDAELAAWQEDLEEIDLLQDYQRAMKGEIAFCCQYYDDARRDRNSSLFQTYPEVSPEGETDIPKSVWWPRVWPHLLPSGWIYQAQILYCRSIDESLLLCVDPTAHVVSPDGDRLHLELFRKEGQQSITVRWLGLAGTLDSQLRAVQKVAQAQCLIDLV